MSQSNIDFVGLDVHKDSVDISVAPGELGAEVRHVAKVAGDCNSIAKVLRRLAKDGRQLNIVYEAGPCGFVLQRHLCSIGFQCEVVAPSLVPQRAGDRIKTDRRDSLRLARSARAGDLTAVRVPDESDEAIRDLTRAREDAVREQRTARHRLKALLLRNGISYSGRSSWGAPHLRWLSEVKLPHPSQQIALQEYIHSISEAGARIVRLELAMREALEQWPLAPVVYALQALRGVQMISAMTLVAEIQDFSRFAHPRALMAYLGLIPIERSSGSKRFQGGITKAGNRSARRLLVEAAHHYRHRARVTKIIAQRLEDLPKVVTDIAWSAQLRLCGRFHRLLARGLNRNKIVVAIARELCGFIWAIGLHCGGLSPKTRNIALTS